MTNRLPTVTSGAGLYDTWTYNLLPAEEGFSPTTTKLFTRISVLPVEWQSGMNNRPKLAYFESRVGSKFSVTLDKNELSSWTLKTVKRLKAQMKKDYVIWNSSPSSSFTILTPPSIKGHTN